MTGAWGARPTPLISADVSWAFDGCVGEHVSDGVGCSDDERINHQDILPCLLLYVPSLVVRNSLAEICCGKSCSRFWICTGFEITELRSTAGICSSVAWA